eukprot:7559194-Alexandrium_andersonii.AAC.1
MTKRKNMPEAFTLPRFVRRDAGKALACNVAEIPLLLPDKAFATLYNEFPEQTAKSTLLGSFALAQCSGNSL